MIDQGRTGRGSATLAVDREPGASERSPAVQGDREPCATADVPSPEAAGGQHAAAPTSTLGAMPAHQRAVPPLRTLAAKLDRLIVALTLGVVAILATGIAFEVLDANAHKWIVSTVEHVGKRIASPFDRMFTPHSAKASVAINWGIAIAVYGMAGRLLARLAARLPAPRAVGTKH
jgi:hypothetical protein